VEQQAETISAEELELRVLWELPRTHKGFHCTFDHDALVRAFRRAREKSAAGEPLKRCRCVCCDSQSA
jgi:hypothetical protein